MATYIAPTLWFLLTGLVFSQLILCSGASEGEKKTYVVYMGDLPKGDFSAPSLHSSMLGQVVGSDRASESLLHSYQRSFNGFVANLTEEEMTKIASMEGVLSVFENAKMQLHTTRSWDFLGFSQSVTRVPMVESNLIIGMLDTGIWPESESFNDTGFGPPPSTWKGHCDSSANFTCNNKIIGARYYRSSGFFPPGDPHSPRDTEGHGSHTTSTAAGRVVNKASLIGLGEGTARGAVPSARIAVYKICWSDGCYSADILAAFDDAIADGVDIISLSVGLSFAEQYFVDPIAIGAFQSMKNGILTSNSAGNSGPGPQSIVNVSPWSLTVAASTIDRKFVADVKLGNHRVYEGIAVNTFTLKKTMYPLVYAGNVPNKRNGVTGSESRFCFPGSLDQKKVKGKIVLCDALSHGEGQLEADAIGTIMRDIVDLDSAISFPLSTSYLNLTKGAAVYKYIKKTRKPKAIIDKSTGIKDISAPFVVSFSSRGPNPITPDILKPDIAAPGVDIVAAWSEATTVTGLPGDKRVVPFNIISGTSMACPHASGAAMYVKSFHPTWSPAAIKSALMTTAYAMSSKKNTDAEFAYGSGLINPVAAANPGLIYDAGESDYVQFLCGQGYSNKSLRILTGSNSTSCSSSNHITVWDLNYPSFALSGPAKTKVTRLFHRTVTNVGSAVSTYKATVAAPPGCRAAVVPSTMSFTAVGQTKKFVLEVSGVMGNVSSGYVVWHDGQAGISVWSPIVAKAFDLF